MYRVNTRHIAILDREKTYAILRSTANQVSLVCPSAHLTAGVAYMSFRRVVTGLRICNAHRRRGGIMNIPAQLVTYCASAFGMTVTETWRALQAMREGEQFVVAHAERKGAKAELKVTKTGIGFQYSFNFHQTKFTIFTNEIGGIYNHDYFDNALDSYYELVQKYNLTPLPVIVPSFFRL